MARRTSRPGKPAAGATAGSRPAGRPSATRRSARARPAVAPPPPSTPRDPIDAALELIAFQGLCHTTLAEVAEAAGISMVDLYRRYPSKAALLAGFVQRVDAAMLDTGPADPTESPRDRLFDIIMRRLDLLDPHKEAVRAIMREAWSDPLTAACGLVLPGRRSLRWMLATAGLEQSGLRGHLQLRGLGLIYLAVLRVWLDDDSPDMAKTMAALDRRLRQTERFMGRFDTGMGRRRRRRSGEATEAEGEI